MSRADADDDRADGLTERYRAASAADPARPSELARRSIIAHARTLAAERATDAPVMARSVGSVAHFPRWPVAVAASVIVAGFAAILAWRLRVPPPSPIQAAVQTRPAAVAEQRTEQAPSGGLPAESFVAEPRASTPVAPNAVTTRSKERRLARTQAPPGAGTARIAAAGPRAADKAADSPQSMESVTVTGMRRTPAPADTVAGLSASAAPARGAPLVSAAESGDLERVDQLLGSGISIDQTDARGRTALLIATLRGDVPMVKRLLAAGARADVADQSGDTALAAAQRQGSAELTRLLEQAAHR